MDVKYFLGHAGEFTRKSRHHDCEVPKGDCWRITVLHEKTGDLYEYYENDRYMSLNDQAYDLGSETLMFRKINSTPPIERGKR